MKYVALVLGFVLLALGVASFIPQALIDGELFGFFPVSVMAGLGMIAGGALGIMAGLSHERELQPQVPSGGHDMREWLVH
jgi:hypothetical protein